MPTMMIVSAIGLVVGGVLFAYAPDGVNALSVGGMAAIVASIVGYFVGMSRSDRESLKPFAEELGLNLEEVVDLGDSRRAQLRGDFCGRPVAMRLQTIWSAGPGRFASGRAIHHVSISVPCANARGTHLRIVSVLPDGDRLLERLPPKLDAAPAWGVGFEIRGEPAEDAAALIARVDAGRWRILEPNGRSGDFVKLLGNECSFEASSGESPSSALIRARLELCVAIAAAAE